MLGKFENFPIFAHKEKTFRFNDSLKNIQRRIIKSIYSLNGKEIPSSLIFNGIDAGFNVIFEIGIAEGLNFNYLDETELKRFLNHLENENFKVLDFFLLSRYYVADSKKRPLKFDYQMIRLEFSKDSFTVKVYHERGPRRIQLEELIDFFAKQFL